MVIGLQEQNINPNYIALKTTKTIFNDAGVFSISFESLAAAFRSSYIKKTRVPATDHNVSECMRLFLATRVVRHLFIVKEFYRIQLPNGV